MPHDRTHFPLAWGGCVEVRVWLICSTAGYRSYSWRPGDVLPVSRGLGWGDAPVIAALTMFVAAKSRWGFLKCCDRLRLEGHGSNHKRLPVQPRQPVAVIPQPNVVRVVDFMNNTLYGDRRFRTPNVLDEDDGRGWPSKWIRRFRWSA